MNWEYRLLPMARDRDESSVQDALNDMGGDGWELVDIYEGGGMRVFVFKKRAK